MTDPAINSDEAARKAALSSLVMIANDDEQDVEDRVQAASVVLNATTPAPQYDQDDALQIVGDQIADRVLERLERAESKS